MKVLDNIELCSGCHACYSICPVQAIQMKKDKEGFLYPNINEKQCIECGQCREVCPILKERVESVCQVFACYDKNKERRLKSASGGVFSLLAEYVIKSGGVVFGAAFNEKMDVEHICAKTLQELDKIKGSKYVQSRIGDQYKVVKQYLQEQYMVLFSGTPCQVGGLKAFLKKEYSNLICIEVVCHGVPSSDVWRKYLCEIGTGKKVIDVKFRDKEKGIKNAPLYFAFDDGSFIKENYIENYFIKGFIKNLYLRYSCYQCKFKGINTVSDITVGDFWGLEKTNPEFDDDYGVSLVMIHTSKGEKIFEKIISEMKFIKCEQEDAVEQNPCIIESVEKPLEREKFFHFYQEVGVIKTIKMITKLPIKERVKQKIKQIKYNVKYQIYLVWRKIQK